MDIKEKIKDLVEDAVAKLKADPELLASFKKEPVKAIEKVIGKDLPDEQIENVVGLIKAKLAGDEVKEKAGSIGDAIKGLGKLFGK